MDPASFFLMLIVAVVVVGGAIVLVAARMLAGGGRDDTRDRGRPLHHPVTTAYHEHTELAATGRERDRSSSDTEHQSD